MQWLQSECGGFWRPRVAGRRDQNSTRRGRSEFLIHMDGLMSEHAEDQGAHVLVMATTNTHARGLCRRDAAYLRLVYC